jgi:pilin isopeptide linkage protein
VVATGTNDADGKITFSAIPYTLPGTHTYTVTEIIGSLNGVTYSTASYTVTVVVEDVAGQLVATATYPDGGLVFTNVFTPNDVTVNLEASKTLVNDLGDVLTLVGGDSGLYFYSTDDTTIARIMGGNFKITAGGVGIRSEYTTLSVTKGTFDIDVPAKDGVAILGRTLKLHGGKFTAQGPITASQNLEIRAANLSVAADRAALSANRKLTLKDVSLSVGNTADDLHKADGYNGENCIRVKSAANLLGESVLFGEAVPMFADILVIVALAALVAAGIGLPLLRAHRRSKRALAAAAEAEKK